MESACLQETYSPNVRERKLTGNLNKDEVSHSMDQGES